LTDKLVYTNISLVRSDKALVFGSTARLKLLNCLKEKSKTVEELIGVCGLSQSAVSQHLRKLKDMGFVKGQESWQESLL